MKNLRIVILLIFTSFTTFAQNADKAKSLLDEVSSKMGAYENMVIDFSSSLSNKEAGINDGDEPPIRGNITLKGEKYNLDYLGNKFIFDGKKLYVINQEFKEVNISNGDMSGDDGFIYPSKLLSFYKNGYNFAWGKLKNESGRSVQYITLNPMDSNADIVEVELAIDAKTKHICKLIQTGANGSKTTLTINSLKSNQPISDQLFIFDQAKYKKLKYTID